MPSWLRLLRSLGWKRWWQSAQQCLLSPSPLHPRSHTVHLINTSNICARAASTNDCRTTITTTPSYTSRTANPSYRTVGRITRHTTTPYVSSCCTATNGCSSSCRTCSTWFHRHVIHCGVSPPLHNFNRNVNSLHVSFTCENILRSLSD